MEYQPISFPQDELAHKTLSEWWYFNGHLESANKRHYSFMSCLFRAKMPKAANARLAKIPSKNIFAYHSILIDVDQQKSLPQICYWVRVLPESFQGPFLKVIFTKPLAKNLFKIEQKDQNHYLIEDDRVHLGFESKKTPLLEGGTGFVQMASKRQTYYYSLTNLKTQGEIILNDKKIKVGGKSWMDHQWMDDPGSKQFWNWFSIQLEDETEIVCIEHGDNREQIRYATISYPDNKQETFHRIEIISGSRAWKSPLTRAVYPLEWQIKIPEKKIDLTIKALVEKQEINFAFINYWEGPHRVSGSIGSKKVKGVGFIEIVGRPSIFNDPRVIKNKVKELIGSKIQSDSNIIE